MSGDGGVLCKIGPSILNSDLSQLYSESQRMLDSGADYLHLDVMDGHFVPNITFGHPVVKCLRQKIPQAYFDVHMMVSDPEKWVEPMYDAGANQYTFHLEAVDPGRVPELCRKIKECGMKVGIGLKPGTPVSSVVEFVPLADAVLIMTVEPGFGGQSFMANMMQKVINLRQDYPNLDIEVDGGVGLQTIDACAKAGANMIVSGTAVMNADDPANVIWQLRQSVEGVLQQSQLER